MLPDLLCEDFLHKKNKPDGDFLFFFVSDDVRDIVKFLFLENDTDGEGKNVKNHE